MQVLSRKLDTERIESPRHYPDNDAVQRMQAAVWVSDVPAYGIASLRYAQGRARTSRPTSRRFRMAASGCVRTAAWTSRGRSVPA